LKTFPPNQQ